MKYGTVVKSALGYTEAVERVKALLREEGFGVLCEIDVAKTLAEKIGAEVPPYVILGACSPQFAHQAIAAEPQLGLLLPCNLVVQEREGETLVSAIDAAALLSVVGNPALSTVAQQVNARLSKVLQAVAAPAG
jgi:uncharacterized protein (DUF302 family)